MKALRKLVIYSYATTIDKSKPKLKELLEFIHTGNSTFKVKVVSKQETDFDAMFQFLEDKNLSVIPEKMVQDLELQNSNSD